MSVPTSPPLHVVPKLSRAPENPSKAWLVAVVAVLAAVTVAVVLLR